MSKTSPVTSVTTHAKGRDTGSAGRDRPGAGAGEMVILTGAEAHADETVLARLPCKRTHWVYLLAVLRAGTGVAGALTPEAAACQVRASRPPWHASETLNPCKRLRLPLTACGVYPPGRGVRAQTFVFWYLRQQQPRSQTRGSAPTGMSSSQAVVPAETGGQGCRVKEHRDPVRRRDRKERAWSPRHRQAARGCNLRGLVQPRPLRAPARLQGQRGGKAKAVLDSPQHGAPRPGPVLRGQQPH